MSAAIEYNGTMIDSKSIQDLVDRLTAALSDALPDELPGIGAVKDEVRGKMEQVLRKGIDELDLLSRDEFEATTERLERAEQRIAELERALANLEEKK